MGQPGFLKGSLRAQIFQSKPENRSATLVEQGFTGIGKGSFGLYNGFLLCGNDETNPSTPSGLRGISYYLQGISCLVINIQSLWD